MEAKLKDALVAVIQEAPSTGFSEYAKTYARVAWRMEGEELRVQLLYVLNNLQYWRGSRAKEIKAILKEYSK